MAFINHSKKILFIHSPRTGGTSFEWALRKNLKDDFESLPKHISFKGLQNSVQEDLTDYKKVSFVRNPWDMVMSWWQWYHESREKLFGLSLEMFSSEEEFSQFITKSFNPNYSKGLFPHTSNKKNLDLLSYFDGANDFKFYKFEDYNNSFKNASKYLLDTPLLQNNYTKTHYRGASEWGNKIKGYKKYSYKEFFTTKHKELVYKLAKNYIDKFEYTF